MEQLLRSTRIVTPTGIVDGAIHISGDRITAVSAAADIPTGIPVQDFGNFAVLPGLVDPHVHINEPGRSDWEGFQTATRAAAAGGITALIDMPLNSSPVTTTLEALREKHAATAGKLTVDVGFHGGLIPGNSPHLGALADAGVFGIKAFLVHSGIDEFPNATESDLRAAMPILQQRNLPLLVHAELDEPSPPPRDGRSDHAAWSASRPQSMEVRAIEMLLARHREAPCPLHIVHLAASNGIPLLREARTHRDNITVETCPHYLHFAEEEIPPSNTLFKCAPPIRGGVNRDALWNGLQSGVIDMIASDHSPCPPAMKALDSGDFFRAWGGISSLQFGLPVLWSHAGARGFGLREIARWMSEMPARIFQLPRHGAIIAGNLANIVVFDTEGRTSITEQTTEHRHKLTPYSGENLRGSVVATYLRGACIFSEGRILGAPGGAILRRK
ncbi:MAG TPA: allantoinase AllB [Candidatus Sumerlaeota bacterium]|nr:allantoinase AllB [Candidatus Sumerlaeota bacterium]